MPVVGHMVASVTPLTITTEAEGDTVVVRLWGELDYTSASILKEEFDRAEARFAPARAHLDLAGVRHLDATGLGLLVAIAKRLRARDGDLRLLNVTPEAMEVLELTGLHEALGASAAAA